MKINEIKQNQLIEITDVSLIKQGDLLWQDGDIVEVKDVDVDEDRIEVWSKDKYLSEFIYQKELVGIKITE